MAQFSALLTRSVVPVALVNAFSFVDFNGATIAASGGQAFGVAAFDITVIGQALPVICKGSARVIAGAAVTLGQQVMSDAQGRAIPYVVAVGNVPLGFCLQAQPTVGQETEILLSY